MSLTKAVVVNLDAPDTPPLPVMFNPPQYELSKTNQFAEIHIPGLPSSVLQFVNGNANSLSIELFFDTTSQGTDVRLHTQAFASLAEPSALTHAPPRLLLMWGSLLFPCVLISVRQTFEYFNSAGLPLRARLQVEFRGQEQLNALVAALPTEALAQATAYVIKPGETLQSIASAVYKDATRWRDIALANELDDPRTLVPGTSLQLPQGR